MKQFTLIVTFIVMSLLMTPGYSEVKKDSAQKVLVKTKVQPDSAEKKEPIKAQSPVDTSIKKNTVKEQGKAPAPAPEKKEAESQILGGPIVSVDQKTQVVVIQRKGKEYPVTINSDTKITQGENSVSLADVKAGAAITAIYEKDAKGIRIAKSLNLDAAAPEQEKAAEKAVPDKKPAPEAEKKPAEVKPKQTEDKADPVSK